MDVERDIRPLTALEENPSKIIRQVRANKRPMMITSRGKPKVVIIPAEMLKDKLTAMRAACELVED